MNMWSSKNVRGNRLKRNIMRGMNLPEYSESNGVKRSTNFVDRFFFAKGKTYS